MMLARYKLTNSILKVTVLSVAMETGISKDVMRALGLEEILKASVSVIHERGSTTSHDG